MERIYFFLVRSDWNIRDYLWPVRSFPSVGLKGPFPFDNIIVPSATFLHPSYKNNNQTRGGLGPVCATEMYRSMYRSIGRGISKRSRQTGIFVEWKAPHA